MEKPPSKLIALVFDDPYTADEARAALLRMTGEGLLETDETAVLVRTADGKTRISQDVNVVARDRQIGHLVGLVAAAATGTMPFILAGTMGGALVGRLTDHSITDRFIGEVKRRLQPSTSTLVVLGRSDPERRQKIFARLRHFKPKVLETDLPPDLERELIQAFQAETGTEVH